MKFNFRKITSVLASAVMLGSTIGVAAAASMYPAPFVKNGATDVALIIGSKASNSDYLASLDLVADLQARLTSQTATGGSVTGATATGENVKIETASSKLHLGDQLTSVRTTKITKSDMPNLLAKKAYRSYDSQTYDYEQEIELAPNLNFTHFADNDLNNRVPTIGLRVPSNTRILNYTINFLKSAESDVTTAGRLEDLQNTKITLLGKEYTLLNAYNASSSTKFDLMAGAATDVLNLNDEKTITVNGKDYTVKLFFVDADSAKLEVNGERTTDLAIGGTFKLADGTQIGIRDISYQSFAGGVQSAEISLGAEKLTLENGQTVKLNDKDITGLTATIARGTTGTTGRVTIQSITVTWQSDDKAFVVAGKDLVMPGLGSVKFTMGDMTFPTTEVVKVRNDGTYNLEVAAPLKDGDARFTIISGNGTSFTRIGKDGNTLSLTNAGNVQLKTTLNNNLVFNYTIDAYFVASWNSSTAAESYLLDARNSQDSSVNYTSIRSITNAGTNEKCKVQIAQTCTIGNVVLTVNAINYVDHSINVTIGSGGSFNKLFTKEGLLMYLPTNESTNVIGYLNLSGANPTTYPIVFYEEDKFSNIAGTTQAMNVTGGWIASDGKVQVTNVKGKLLTTDGNTGDTNYFELASGTQKYVGYVKSDLGSKMTYDQSPTQDTAEIEYHGAESFGNLFIASPDAAVSGSVSGGGKSGASLGLPAVTDAEVSSVSDKNLIVLGGSCVNTVAAELLGSKGTPLCGSDFTNKTGVGADQFLIKILENPYSSTKVAMLVAGYEAADTKVAVKYLITKTPVTDKDTEIKKGSAEALV